MKPIHERIADAFKDLKGDPAKIAAALHLADSTVTNGIRRARELGLLPPEKTETETQVDRLKTKLSNTEAQLAAIQRDNISAAEIRQTIYGLAAQTPDPPKWVARAPNVGHTGMPVFQWSDWHWGEKVFREQVGGVNEYDRKIAKTRLGKLVDISVELAIDHMVKPDYPGCVLLLSGDMISGNIHDELRETNDGPIQVTLLEVQEQLIAAIEYLADRFGRVFVSCVVGNHGRGTLKVRAKNRIHEAFEWNLYCQLETYFKAKGDDRIDFQIPDETDAYINIMGFDFLHTHGDSLGVKGGDGIIGVIGPMARGTVKVGRSEGQIGRDFYGMVAGHYHTRLPFSDAIPASFNGSMIGYNEYGRLFLRVPYARPSQNLFFVNAKYGVTAQWPVYLEPLCTSQEARKVVTLSWETKK